MNYIIQGSDIFPKDSTLFCAETLVEDTGTTSGASDSTAGEAGKRSEQTVSWSPRVIPEHLSDTPSPSSENAVDSGDSYHPDSDSGDSTDSYWSEPGGAGAGPSVVNVESRKRMPSAAVSSAKRTKARSGMAQKDQWKRNANKDLRMKGQTYMGSTKGKDGKMITDQKQPRRQGPKCTSAYCMKSKLRNCNDISEEDRTELFNSFWTKLDWKQRKTYVASLVDCKSPQNCRRKESRRSGTLQNHLRVNGGRRRVCRTMFLNTFGLREWSVRAWAKAGHTHGMQESSQRSPPKVCDDAKAQLARSFLESLPKLSSHYCRKDSTKLYLETSIESKIQLYKLFQSFCDAKGVKHVSRQVLYQTAKVMNIGIFKPRKDQCNVCLSFDFGQCSQKEYDTHMKRKQEAQDEKTRDKRLAEDDRSVLVITMDLQIVLLAPKLFANASYYKTKLSCHNFTVYDVATRDCTCYFWHEASGEVTSNTFASCVMDYLENAIASRPIRTIILYSDGCCYQNRNVIMSNCLLHLATEAQITIIQKYLEKGHSWMEVDSVHSTIERRLRHRQIYWPADYIEVISSARTHPSPYIVKNLHFSFFRDFSKIMYYRSIRPGNSAGDSQVVDIRGLLYSPDGVIQYKLHHWTPLARRLNKATPVRGLLYSPDGVIQYKLHHSDAWTPLPRRPNKATPVSKTQLYKQPRPIKKTKWEHLQQLKMVIPREYHAFYDQLVHD